MSINDVTWQDTARAMRPAIGISVWLLVACILASAQITTPLDGYTPLSLAPGAPAGSYPLSGFYNINLFNGNLNFSLPFLQIGGRGSAQFTMRLNIENRWHIETAAPPPNCEITLPDCNPIQFPMNRWWTSRTRWDGFTPGKLVGRQPGYKQCGPGLTVTRLTFSANELTEFELRDLIFNGQPLQMLCNQPAGISRGKVFVTADGTAATFVSDTTISDYTGTQPSFQITPSGYLMMRDGTRYRIDNQGRVTSIRDRNGNRIDFTYDQSGKLIMIQDSLNRVVTISYALTEAPYGTHDKIVFKGFGGAERTIRISYGAMETALRSGFALKSTAQLFPEADFPDLHTSNTPYNPTVTTALWLPDGRRYQFLYDNFGNLARVVLPAGGALEYDYGHRGRDPDGPILPFRESATYLEPLWSREE